MVGEQLTLCAEPIGGSPTAKACPTITATGLRDSRVKSTDSSERNKEENFAVSGELGR